MKVCDLCRDDQVAFTDENGTDLCAKHTIEWLENNEPTEIEKYNLMPWLRMTGWDKEEAIKKAKHISEEMGLIPKQ